jgi:hypothetical protein
VYFAEQESEEDLLEGFASSNTDLTRSRRLDADFGPPNGPGGESPERTIALWTGLRSAYIADQDVEEDLLEGSTFSDTALTNFRRRVRGEDRVFRMIYISLTRILDHQMVQTILLLDLAF